MPDPGKARGRADIVCCAGPAPAGSETPRDNPGALEAKARLCGAGQYPHLSLKCVGIGPYQEPRLAVYVPIGVWRGRRPDGSAGAVSKSL